MRYVVRRLSNGTYEVERSHGWWFWRVTYCARAIWAEELGCGEWQWLDGSRVEDVDTRIALSEAHNEWLKLTERDKWELK